MFDTIYAVFARQVRVHPNAPAVIEEGRSYTFSQLEAMADSIAQKLDPEWKTIGIIMPHGVWMIAAILAVLKNGACYVPAEIDFPKKRIAFMMQEAGVSAVLIQEELPYPLENLPVVSLQQLLHTVRKKTNEDGQKCLPEAMPAYILYTSGTTGKPKGVIVSNANVLHYVNAFANEFHPGPGDIMLQNSVCSFDIFTEEVFCSLLNGAALAIAGEQDKQNIEKLMEFVSRHGVTMLSGFPYLLEQMNRLEAIPDCLRLLISGGDVLRESYISGLKEKVSIYNTYGPSETTVCAAYYDCSKGEALEDGTFPIGKAVLGSRIEIRDGNGDPLPDGRIGEICIFGGGVSLGYAGNRREENQAFVEIPAASSMECQRNKDRAVERMYRSGDLGYVLPDGNIAFCGRQDGQIMIFGKRVEIAEVESRLNQCSQVKKAIVRAFQDEMGLSYMTAYIVPACGNVKVSLLKQELQAHLTPFMIPEFFVQLSEIPYNANGKPDHSALPVVLKEGALL